MTAAERELRRDTADLLHQLVAAMNLDNFVVRPHRRWVQTYSRRLGRFAHSSDAFF